MLPRKWCIAATYRYRDKLGARTDLAAVLDSQNCVGGFAASIGEKGVKGRTAMKFSP